MLPTRFQHQSSTLHHQRASSKQLPAHFTIHPINKQQHARSCLQPAQQTQQFNCSRPHSPALYHHQQQQKRSGVLMASTASAEAASEPQAATTPEQSLICTSITASTVEAFLQEIEEASSTGSHPGGKRIGVHMSVYVVQLISISHKHLLHLLSTNAVLGLAAQQWLTHPRLPPIGGLCSYPLTSRPPLCASSTNMHISSSSAPPHICPASRLLWLLQLCPCIRCCVCCCCCHHSQLTTPPTTGVDVLELRLDFLQDFQADRDLERLMAACSSLPYIITYRPTWEG